jgi:hypothetical protein
MSRKNGNSAARDSEDAVIFAPKVKINAEVRKLK